MELYYGQVAEHIGDFRGGGEGMGWHPLRRPERDKLEFVPRRIICSGIRLAMKMEGARIGRHLSRADRMDLDIFPMIFLAHWVVRCCS